MWKFSVKEKLEIVLRYLEGNEVAPSIGRKYGVSKTQIYSWAKLYSEWGIEGFRIKDYASYSPEFKLEVLEYRLKTKASYVDIAAHFGIPSPSPIKRWVKEFERKGFDAFKAKKKGRTSMNKETKKPTKQDEGSLEKLQAENERLRMENAYFKKVECLSSKQGKITKQDKAQVVYELRREFPVIALLQLAGIPRSTYYYVIKSFGRPDPDGELKVLIQSIYDEHEGRYGYRRIRDELRNREHQVNHKKVQRIMKELGLISIVRVKKYRSYKGKVGQIAPNLLDRNFKAERPNQKWVTDITEFKLLGEKLYLSPVLDLYNGEIISYTIGFRPTYSLVSDMLEQAFERLTIEGKLLMHSDQGWHYQMKQYRQALQRKQITQSMSRKGNCYDNSVMENFFGILKSEFLYIKEFKSIEHFKEELSKYINYYNYKRIKSKLKGMSPVQYRTHAQQTA
ncbi:IS3 family transposase [Paenibacillus sp. D2_2]|uniref:IS3 family transposase n=1 Tax=Paenibacillus sp. D2_2 TaxID=3073092 RepID=UPI002815B6A5|nr:IS3 family transposase [Paenibacillus sp. D2_2]WMT42168.1 IS3 family transposase [Paenibacillus sp. D2_2]WMT42667.1 IS3 family transposase [Paenibacillus sp. D2_2]